MEDGLSQVNREMDELSRGSERELAIVRQLADAYDRAAASRERLGAAEDGSGSAAQGAGRAAPGSLVPAARPMGSAGSIFGGASTGAAPSGLPFGGLAGTTAVITGFTAIAQQVLTGMRQHEEARQHLASAQLKISERGFELAKERQFDFSNAATDELMNRRAYVNAPVNTGNALASYITGDRRTQQQVELRNDVYDALLKEKDRKVGQLTDRNTLLNAGDIKNAMQSLEVQRKQTFMGRVEQSDGTASGNVGSILGWAWDQSVGRLTGSLDEQMEKDAADLAKRRVKAVTESNDRYQKDLESQPWYKTEARNRALLAGAMERDRMMQKQDWNKD